MALADIVKARQEGTSAGVGSGSDASQRAKDIITANGWDGASCPTEEQLDAIMSLKNGSAYSAGYRNRELPLDGKCCYGGEDDPCGQTGRPFLIDGQERVAELVIDTRTRQLPTLAQTWLKDALLEHASVAAFARLSLQLLSFAAPAELVQQAQLASLDELRHADFCFEMASRYAGMPLRPGPLSVAGALDDLSLAGLVRSNLLEGCIGETLAAEQLRRRAAETDDPKLRAALLGIAEDETRHAALAFRILAWCRDSAPELTREIVAQVLGDERDDDETWLYVLAPLLGALAD